MTSERPPGTSLVSEASPGELRDPKSRAEVKRAAIWLGMVLALALFVLLIQPLLLIFAGVVIASMLDGGTRLLGRVLKVARGWRLLIVVLGVILFLVATFVMTGVQVTQQVQQLRGTLEGQAVRLTTWLTGQGLMPGASDVSGLVRQAMSSLGRLTSWVGTAFGIVANLFIILVIGLFLAMEPRVYERGLQWLVPRDMRAEFALTLDRMGKTLRRLMAGRLLGMLVEGVFIWLSLAVGGVPMAALLGIIAGILAFIPNIGAFVTGVLMVAVGFSAGVDTGFWAIGTWIIVQGIDGYVVAPVVARRTVDMPPALTLGMQILAGALFGVLGLALADPFTAMAKTALDRASERNEEESGVDGAAG